MSEAQQFEHRQESGRVGDDGSSRRVQAEPERSVNDGISDDEGYLDSSEFANRYVIFDYDEYDEECYSRACEVSNRCVIRDYDEYDEGRSEPAAASQPRDPETCSTDEAHGCETDESVRGPSYLGTAATNDTVERPSDA